MAIYDKVKNECEKHNMTIMELEKRAEIANGVVGKWRESKPNIDTLLKVQRFSKSPSKSYWRNENV